MAVSVLISGQFEVSSVEAVQLIIMLYFSGCIIIHSLG